MTSWRPGRRGIVRLWALVAAWGLAAASAGMATPLADAAQSPPRDDLGQPVPAAAAAPMRIISMLPSLTETVCALDACSRLVGTDRWSNWPASVRTLPKLGGLEDTQIERLVALRPDLVLVPGSSRALGRLRALGLPVLALEPQSLADTRRVVSVVAHALGRPSAGDALWAQVEHRIAESAQRVPPSLRGQRVYVEVATAPYAAGEASFVGELLARMGLGNIVPAALGPFPRLAPEAVVRAQPDLIVVAEAELAGMARRPGWAALHALRDGRHCALNPEAYDTLVRPGPRLADAAAHLADCLQRLGEAPLRASGLGQRLPR